MSKKWFESWFDSDLYDLMYSHRSVEEADSFISHLLEELNPDDGSRFLDLACGKGRHSIMIHKRGFEVTGIDLSQRKILEASKESDEGLEFFVHDMRKPFRINYFDIVLNLFTSFGYFEEPGDDRKVIQSVISGLKPNGTFVIDYLNDVFAVDQLIPFETKKFGDWQVEIKKEVKDGRLVKEMFWSNGAITRDYQESVRLYSEKDLIELVTKEGLKVKSVFGDYNLNTYSQSNSPRLILICTC